MVETKLNGNDLHKKKRKGLMNSSEVMELFEQLKKVSREGFKAGDILIEMLQRAAKSIESQAAQIEKLGAQLSESLASIAAYGTQVASLEARIAEVTAQWTSSQAEAAKYAEAYAELLKLYENDAEKLAEAARILADANAKVETLKVEVDKSNAAILAAQQRIAAEAAKSAAIAAEYEAYQAEAKEAQETLVQQIRDFIAETTQEQADVMETAREGSV